MSSSSSLLLAGTSEANGLRAGGPPRWTVRAVSWSRATACVSDCSALSVTAMNRIPTGGVATGRHHAGAAVAWEPPSQHRVGRTAAISATPNPDQQREHAAVEKIGP